MSRENKWRLLYVDIVRGRFLYNSRLNSDVTEVLWEQIKNSVSKQQMANHRMASLTENQLTEDYNIQSFCDTRFPTVTIEGWGGAVGIASDSLSVSRVFEPHQRVPLFSWVRNFTLIVLYFGSERDIHWQKCLFLYNRTKVNSYKVIN